jgi:hypothetical protein
MVSCGTNLYLYLVAAAAAVMVVVVNAICEELINLKTQSLQILYKNSVRASQKTHHVSATKIK